MGFRNPIDQHIEVGHVCDRQDNGWNEEQRLCCRIEPLIADGLRMRHACCPVRRQLIDRQEPRIAGAAGKVAFSHGLFSPLRSMRPPRRELSVLHADKASVGFVCCNKLAFVLDCQGKIHAIVSAWLSSIDILVAVSNRDAWELVVKVRQFDSRCRESNQLVSGRPRGTQCWILTTSRLIQLDRRV